ncbi:hypothetical protein ABZ858_36535 [Streptomyces sp. NPDC047017]|uniref:hypothetical protein n=1 Tax=Streptomyces sp. NPDC047017 TaxID=3155024 RepID=UPI00340E7737
MTASQLRAARPRRAAGRRAVLGGAAGLLWLVLGVMTIIEGTAVASPALPRPAGPVSAAARDETSGADLVLPLVAVGAALVLAGYGHVRRTRRARTRTTPGGARRDERAADEGGRALVPADDCVRASAAELGFAEALFGAAAVAPYREAVRAAEGELAAACRQYLRRDRGLPGDDVTGHCEEAGRLLDAAADAFAGLRGLERDPAGALEAARARCRELAARTAPAEAALAALAVRYGPAASEQAAGHPAQARDRLVFATARLDEARQAAGRGERERAADRLRAAEGAVAQAAVFLDGVDRLAAELDEAAALLPAALNGAQAERAAAADRLTGTPAGEERARLLHAGAELASVRQESAAGRPYDPAAALRRIVRAAVPLAAGRSGVLSAAALLTARAATAAAAGFVTTHRGAVGATPRALLAEAQRLLASADPADHLRADALAREAHGRAEQDVRTHGNPYAGPDAPTGTTAGAVLGGILLPAPPPVGPPPRFGGPRTRDADVTNAEARNAEFTSTDVTSADVTSADVTSADVRTGSAGPPPDR